MEHTRGIDRFLSPKINTASSSSDPLNEEEKKKIAITIKFINSLVDIASNESLSVI